MKWFNRECRKKWDFSPLVLEATYQVWRRSHNYVDDPEVRQAFLDNPGMQAFLEWMKT